MPKSRKLADPFNRALGIFLEWGPARSIDVRVRIKKALPALRPAEIKKLEAEFWELMSAACRIVEENVERHQSEDDARIKVAALDPRVSPENASNLYSQARYSAWRDGYR